MNPPRRPESDCETVTSSQGDDMILTPTTTQSYGNRPMLGGSDRTTLTLDRKVKVFLLDGSCIEAPATSIIGFPKDTLVVLAGAQSSMVSGIYGVSSLVANQRICLLGQGVILQTNDGGRTAQGTSFTSLPSGTILDASEQKTTNVQAPHDGVLTNHVVLSNAIDTGSLPWILNCPLVLGPGGVLAHHNMTIFKSMMIGGDIQLKRETLFPEAPVFPSRFPRAADIMEKGSNLPAKTILPPGTTLHANMRIPGGTVIPAGTKLKGCVLPAGTILTAGTKIPKGMELPKDVLKQLHAC